MKTLKINYTACIFLFVLSIVSCSKDCIDSSDETIVSETLDFRDFNAIETNGAIHVNLIEGDHFNVIAHAKQGVIDQLNAESKIEDNTFIIQTKNICFTSTVNIDITLPEFVALHIRGSGDIVTVGNFSRVNDLDLKITGSGNINLENLRLSNEVPQNNTTIDIDGSGDIQLIGAAKKTTLKIDGSGKFIGFEYVNSEVDITVNGSGDCELFANDKLDITINGSGEICYKGNPSISSKINGSGRVNDCN